MRPPPVSFVLMAHEQADFVREAAEAALAQDHHPLEVILSDDASRDGTWDVLQDVAARYRGPHEVVLNRNRENLGHAHLGPLVQRARGELVVIAHGDDVSRPGRTRALRTAWLERRPALLASNAALVDRAGKPLGLLVRDAEPHAITTADLLEGGWRKTLLGSTFAVDRRVFDAFGGLPAETLPRHSGDDHVLPFLASLAGGVYYLAEPLVEHRVHGANGTHFLCDKLGSEESFRETYAAFETASLVAMRESLVALERRAGATPESRAARERLGERILEQTTHWVRLRSALTRAGRRPTWVEERARDGERAAQRFPLVPERPHLRFRWRRLLGRLGR